VPLLASCLQSAFPRCEESEEPGLQFRRKGYRLPWASDLQPLGAAAIPGEPQLSKVLEPTDSEEFLLAPFASKHFRWAPA
jgi:hypothetical protein